MAEETQTRERGFLAGLVRRRAFWALAVAVVAVPGTMLAVRARRPRDPFADARPRYPYDDTEMRRLLGMPLSPRINSKTTDIPGTIQYARFHGPRLLRSEDFKGAAEAYGEWSHLIPEGLRGANRLDLDPNSPEWKLHRFRLLDFMFRHANLARLYRAGAGAAVVRDYGKEYAGLLDSLPEEAKAGALDLTGLELFEEAMGSPSGGSQAKVSKALEARPASVFVIAAFTRKLSYNLSGRRPGAAETLAEARRLAQSPLARLYLAREVEVHCHNVIDQWAAAASDVTDAGAPHAPTEAEGARLLLVRAKIHGGLIALGVRDIDARKVTRAARRVYEKYPATGAAAEARAVAASALVHGGDTTGAVKLIRALAKDPAQRAGLDEALFAVAQARYKEKDYARSAALLEEAAGMAGRTPTASRIMLGLSETYAAVKNREKELEWLKKCAALEVTEETGRGLMDTDNTRSVAIQRLAARFEKDGMWQEALWCWTAWRPQSWCGTCAASMSSSRNEHIDLCRRKLGMPRARGPLPPQE